METKLYDKNCITLDGKLDEAVWQTAEAHTGFKALKSRGGAPEEAQTTFYILPCEDRVYFGIKCDEPDIEKVVATYPKRTKYCSDAVEFFLAPSGDGFDFYQFLITVGNHSDAFFYSEGGNIQPDAYAPQWRHATYVGEDYWSAEVELPLTAFYMTTNNAWRENWLMNVCRTRTGGGGMKLYNWSDAISAYAETESFLPVGGFPMRPAENDIRMSTAFVQIDSKTDSGVAGKLTVSVTSPVDADFEFISTSTGTVDVTLKVGENELCIPCCFAEEGRHQVDLELKRKSDGVSFKRWYPVRVFYEPIKLNLTLPEYRGNFYPGQDYSKVAGKVIAAKPVTITLEGPGIGTKTVKPDAEGNFSIDTPDFAYGDAMLTITDGADTFTKKIRRLPPSGHRMAWISGGNLVVDGKPTLRRNMYADYFMGGEAFKRRYGADNLHVTKGFGSRNLEPGRLLQGCETTGSEATLDQKPSDEMYRRVAKVVESAKDTDFVYYYLCDEPECRNISPVYLKHLYDFVSDLDPYHVILIGSRSAAVYVDCADWFECHPYIDVQVRDGKRYCNLPINTLGKFIGDVLAINKSDKCVGFLPTCFSYRLFNAIYAEYPNFDEMICHTWAAMLPGAKSLWPYAYHDLNDRAALYEGIRYLFSTFEALEDMVLLAKRTELIYNQNVHAVHYALNGEEMFVLVNLVDEPQTVTLDGISGSWYNFRHGGMITGNTFDLKPYEVVIGTSKIRDEGLPTYQEEKALVDKLEYERTHTGSLFFDRHADIPVKASASAWPCPYKLFDGVRDNRGLGFRRKGDFCEMDITKLAVTFSKLVVYGYQIEDMQVMFRNDGELSVPAFKEVKAEPFSMTYIFEKPVSPDAIRFEFEEHDAELYEIEAF